MQTVDLFSGASFLYSRELCACGMERRVIIGGGRRPSAQVHKMLNRARCPAAQSTAAQSLGAQPHLREDPEGQVFLGQRLGKPKPPLSHPSQLRGLL